jgi:hypothetical protein
VCLYVLECAGVRSHVRVRFVPLLSRLKVPEFQFRWWCVPLSPHLMAPPSSTERYVYCLTKRCAMLTCAPSPFQVTTVCPGYVATTLSRNALTGNGSAYVQHHLALAQQVYWPNFNVAKVQPSRLWQMSRLSHQPVVPPAASATAHLFSQVQRGRSLSGKFEREV